MTNSISPGALRAADEIHRQDATTHLSRDWIAKIVDDSTGLSELLEALREIDSMLKGDMPITSQVKEIAQAAIKKSEGTI